jgi:DNA-directed RNA polymerase subunit RPC12/RpoP
MELVTVRTFNNYISANLLLSKLRNGGIECYLRDEHTVTMNPFLNYALGRIKLVVKEEDVAEVLELLNHFDEDFKKKTVCPRCGSHNIELVPKQNVANMVTAILSWIFSKYAVSVENVYKCGNCGYESSALPESLNTDTGIFEPENLN